MYHVAQLNVATLLAPLGDPLVAPFERAIAHINALGDSSPGWVWRFQTDEGDATSVRAFPDPRTIVNLTVWESIDQLKDFAYRSEHGEFVRRRREWFRPGGTTLALWWIRAGEIPTLEGAKRRLEFLDHFGASPYSFGFARPSAPLVLDRAALDDPDVQALIARLDTELEAAYPEPGANHFGLTADQVAPGRGELVVARLDGDPVACGAVRMIGDGTAEIKRMFVDPAARGRKLGAAVLDHLEGVAIGLGATRLVLETGTRQPEAIGLYHRFGFEQVPCWGEYTASAATSVCMTKALTPT